MPTSAPGPGRVVQSRIATGNGLAEACLDTNKTAWVRILDGEWMPWQPVASNVVDVDVAAAEGGGMAAIVIVTHAPPGGREIHGVALDGTVSATSY